MKNIAIMDTILDFKIFSYCEVYMLIIQTGIDRVNISELVAGFVRHLSFHQHDS